MRDHPDWCECRHCLKRDELEQEAALAALDGTGFDTAGIEHALSRVDDPAVEAEHSSMPTPVPNDNDEWVEWAKEKLDPYEQAGVDPPG